MRGVVLFLLALVAGAAAGAFAPLTLPPAEEGPLAAAAPQPAPPSLPATSEAEVRREGRLGYEAVACSPGVGCLASPPVAGAQRSWALELPGELRGFTLNLTWAPANPAMGTLQLGVLRCPDGAASCDEAEAEWVAFAEGASPLRIDADDLAFPAGTHVTVFVWRPDALTGPAAFQATTEQPFSLEGSVRFAL